MKNFFLQKKWMVIFIFLFSFSLVSALDVSENPSVKGVVITPPTAAVNYSIQNVNSSEYWDNLDDPSDISISDLAAATATLDLGSENFQTTGLLQNGLGDSITIEEIKDAYDKRVDSWVAPLDLTSNIASIILQENNLQIVADGLDTIQDIDTSANFEAASFTGTAGAHSFAGTSDFGNVEAEAIVNFYGENGYIEMYWDDGLFFENSTWIRLRDAYNSLYKLGKCEVGGDSTGICLRAISNPVSAETLFKVEASGGRDELAVYHNTHIATRNPCIKLSEGTSDEVSICAYSSQNFLINSTINSYGYKVNGTAGISDSSSYWLCTADDCSSTCQVTIIGGIITGCT